MQIPIIDKIRKNEVKAASGRQIYDMKGIVSVHVK